MAPATALGLECADTLSTSVSSWTCTGTGMDTVSVITSLAIPSRAIVGLIGSIKLPPKEKVLGTCRGLNVGPHASDRVWYCVMNCPRFHAYRSAERRFCGISRCRRSYRLVIDA